MSSKECICKMSSYLFWDTDINNVDMDMHPSYIIQRVMEYGQLEDWHLIPSFLGESEGI